MLYHGEITILGMKMNIIKSLITALLLSNTVMAIEPIQEEAGWSGFLVLGAGHLKYKNNEVAGSELVDVEDKQINHLGSASYQTTTLPVVTGTLRYTLENKKTELFVGNSLEDFLRMDATLALGIRHDFDGIGILGVRILASATPTEVWEDPFLTGMDRTSTDRSSAGLGLKWERILDSKFDIDFRVRDVTFKNDINGLALVDNLNAGSSAGANGEVFITDTQQKLLEREGILASLELLYTWRVNQNNLLSPSVKYIVNDRDGKARDFSQAEVQLGHAFFNRKWLIATNVFVGQSEYDTENPIFNEYEDKFYYGAGVNATYKRPFGWEHWGVNINASAIKGNSEIDFYDTSAYLVSLALAYNF